MRLLLGIALVTTLLIGCWTTHQRDNATIAAIQKTIDNREKDFAYWKATMKKALDAVPSGSTVTAEIPGVVEALERSENAEVLRLKALKFAEEQKTP